MFFLSYYFCNPINSFKSITPLYYQYRLQKFKYDVCFENFAMIWDILVVSSTEISEMNRIEPTLE